MNRAQNKDLKVLVTGGSRGIGRAICLYLAQTSARIIILNYLQNDVEAEKTRKLIEANNTKCILAKANLLNLNEIDDLFIKIKDKAKSLDVFIHCAALGTFKPLMEIKPNQWDMTMNINARSFLYCVQKSVSLMKKGKIIAISSLGSRKAVPNYGAMGPTKAALESIIKYLAVELAPKEIQVNGVIGGFIKTDSIYKFPDADNLIKEAEAKTPAGRLGTPEDIAGAVMFLISDSASWIYGQILIADGGISLL